MALHSVNQLSDLLGIDRRTCKTRLDGYPFQNGPKGAFLYETEQVLMIRPAGGEEAENEAIDSAEASRRLTIARTRQIDLEMEVTRKERWPKADVEEIHDSALSNVAGLLKAHEGKMLDSTLIQDIFTELRGVGAALAKL